MKLTAKSDIEVPLAFAYQCITDFESWERVALRRGAEVARTSGASAGASGDGTGTIWRIRFPFRGKIRSASVTLAELIREQSVAFSMGSPSMDGQSLIELQALSPRRTRIKVTAEAKPKTLAARLFINTLRLARGRVSRKFEARVDQVGADITDRYQRSRLAAAKS